MKRVGGLLLVALLVVPTPALGADPSDALLARLGRQLATAVDQARELVTPPSSGGVPRPPGARIVRAGPRASGAVALTFDDGFNHRACARIADTLRARKAVGTFFINGNLLKAEPGRWRRILRGMEVGNHTRSHYDLTREPHPVVRKQIRENEAIHEQVLGTEMLKVLRPPYGRYGARIGRIAYGLGNEHVAMWNVDTGDWRPGTKPRRVYRRAIGARPGSIILMHCSRNATAKALPAIIRHYRSRGIELVGLSEVLGL